MRPDDLLQLLRTRPFRPFRLSLSDGRQFEVRHPETAMVGRSTTHVGIPASDGPEGQMDRIVVCALIHITTTEPIEDSATSE
jgi:hypothetical protein